MAEYIIIRRHKHEVPDRSPIEDAVYCKIKGENHYLFDLCKVDVVKKQLVLQEPFAGVKEFELVTHPNIPDAAASIMQMFEGHQKFDPHDQILIMELDDYINEIITDYELNVYPKLEKILGAPPCPRVPIPCSSLTPEVSEDTFVCTFCGHRHQKNTGITWVRSHDNEKTFDWRGLEEVKFCQECYQAYCKERAYHLRFNPQFIEASFRAGSELMDKRAARLDKEKT